SGCGCGYGCGSGCGCGSGWGCGCDCCGYCCGAGGPGRPAGTGPQSGSGSWGHRRAEGRP
ncbi:hypothetical protein FD755_006582, partial [Muntiacus reevesi]